MLAKAICRFSRNCFAFGILLLLSMLVVRPARAANIITFGVNPGTCGGAVICSSNGTQGYLINGTGQAFDLSTVSQWFQIDPNNSPGVTSENFLPISQPGGGEPDGGAGGFLVINNTGKTVTSFSLTLTDTFTSGTPSVSTCGPGPNAGKPCDNFTAQGGTGTLGNWNTELSGPDWNDCTQGTTVGMTCQGGPGGVAADFAPHLVTYSWSGGSIAPGATFDISFASWQQNSTAPNGAFPSPVPEPSSLLLFGSGLLAAAGFARRKLSQMS